MRNISQNGLKFTAAWENFRSMPYFATAKERELGIYTWGYGHTSTTPPRNNISQEDAYKLLEADMAKAVAFADRNVSTKLNQAQFDAICDLCFNVGLKVIEKDDILGDFDDAARNGDVAYMQRTLPQFRMQAGKVLPGLVRRANGRLALFNGDAWDVAERKGRTSI